MANDARLVDQEKSSEGYCIINQDVVIASNLLVEVGNEWVVDLSETALGTRQVAPGEVGIVAIHRNADNFHA